VCPVLARHHMLHLGVVEAVAPYRFARRSTRALELLACFGGEGRVLVEGVWRTLGPGMTVLLPQNSVAGYFATGREPWKLVWVCYRWPESGLTLSSPNSPVLASHDPMPLLHAVEGLRHECLRSDPEIACMEQWCSLIHLQVLRFARPWGRADPMRRLWARVAASLGEEWTLARLAGEAGCCEEALRRRCQREFGRSPAQQLAFLRQRRAAELLLGTDAKLEVIAEAVGYGDAFAFSAAFKKWCGLPPREFRERRGVAGPSAGEDSPMRGAGLAPASA
jgi:AraC-like DNA-binding protein